MNREHPADTFEDCCVIRRPIGFTSQKEFWATCPYSPRKVKGSGYGWSVTSQADADAMALEHAQTDAENRINCLTTPIGASTI